MTARDERDGHEERDGEGEVGQVGHEREHLLEDGRPVPGAAAGARSSRTLPFYVRAAPGRRVLTGS